MARYLIVGGSSGVGKELVQQLLVQNHEVVVICRNEPEVDGITYFPWDVADGVPPQIEGSLNGIVYCPGTINLKPLKQLSVDDFRHDFEINCIGAVAVIKAYLPLLESKPASSIVLFSTVAVQRGMAFHASVAAAKGAVEGVTRSLAAELAPKIRVNCIAPSLTETPLAKALLKGRDVIEKRHPLKRLGEASDIASLTKFLLSQEASWVTGQVIGVDGGLSTLSVF